jgi:hypothetical protein
MSVRGIDASQIDDARRRSQRCVDEALASATQLAALSLALSGAFVYGLQRWSPSFKGRFNASVKAAFVVMPAFYSFYLESERAVYRCHSRAGSEHMNHAKLRAMRGGGGGGGGGAGQQQPQEVQQQQQVAAEGGRGAAGGTASGGDR